MTRQVRRRLAVIGVTLAGLALGSCIFLPDFASQKRAGKYEPAVEDPRPRTVATTPKAEKQTEPHTCGLHAMRSMYVAYGLDPDVHRLRFRLGTDQPAMRADKDSTGTLHPDLYRVLAQDGFSARPIDLEGRASSSRDLDAHLSTGQLALAVVYRSTYHWVLLSGSSRGSLVVTDSLAQTPQTLDVEDFLDEALSITLISPAHAGEAVSAADAHAAGLAEMARLYQRR